VLSSLRNQVVLVTGSAGLIGRSLIPRLQAAGAQTTKLDLREPNGDGCGNILDCEAVAAALQEVTGIVHLAAVSRVIWGEQKPDHCRAVNFDGTTALLRAAAAAPRRPWLLYASSREVYGQQDIFPVSEDAPLRPMNVYARSKAAAEGSVAAARNCGAPAAILRFSSVYGDIHDHADRVVPAFLRAAVAGTTLRVEGSRNGFDFTHVTDVADGVALAAALMADGETSLPPLHFVSGDCIRLNELAAMAIDAGGNGAARVIEAPARDFDVHMFQGDPARAHAVLGWRTRTPLAVGLAQLAAAFRDSFAAR
jgi:nucleoside-diphosphate-sugar epimerase